LAVELFLLGIANPHPPRLFAAKYLRKLNNSPLLGNIFETSWPIIYTLFNSPLTKFHFTSAETSQGGCALCYFVW
jgi:hypothetical protein